MRERLSRRQLVIAASAALLGAASVAHAASPSLPTLLELSTRVKGFERAPAPSGAPVAYVFFDAQCPHCGTLWENAKALSGKARIVWVPVALLSQKSVTQGAAILASSNPAATMDAHEKLMSARAGGIQTASFSNDAGALMRRNTETFQKLEARSVPYVLAWPTPATAVPVTRAGALSSDELAKLLGIGR